MELNETIEPAGEDADPPECRFQVHLADEQNRYPVDAARLQQAVQAILQDSSFRSAEVSIAVVDDPSIHKLNRQYLDHDYPTDVLSFPLVEEGDHLEGQLIVSADTAANNATEYGWSAENELLLYVVHGALHLVGYRDKSPTDIEAMRAAEVMYLRRMGVEKSDSCEARREGAQ